MGFRFRRSIRFGKGLRINLSKSGASLSVGRRGATVNFGPKGEKVTLGIPGSGFSYSTTVRSSTGRHPSTATENQQNLASAAASSKSHTVPWLFIIAIVLVLAVGGFAIYVQSNP